MTEAIPYWSAEGSRGVVARLVLEFDWTLVVPAHPGDSDGDGGEADAVMLRDPVTGGPLLSGEGLAGAVRRYLRVRELGYGWDDSPMGRGGPPTPVLPAHMELLGDEPTGTLGRPSSLIVDDALVPGASEGNGIPVTPEWRMSVGIDSVTGARSRGALFSMEAWPAGTTFGLRFELVVTQDDDERALRRALAAVIEGFHDGGVRVGAKTRRGFGRGVVTSARARWYDLVASKPRDGLVDWLRWGARPLAEHPAGSLDVEADGVGAAEVLTSWLLREDLPLPDRRRRTVLAMCLRPWSSLLMGGGEGPADATQYTAPHGVDGNEVIVARGTGLAGPLRARVLRVAHVLAKAAGVPPSKAEEWRNDLFGWVHSLETPGEAARASRVRVDEAALEQAQMGWVQAHVAIDPFLGGAIDGKLYFEEPALANETTRLPLRVEVEDASDADVGIVLFAARDAWAMDLAFGQGSGIGRGRQVGVEAVLQRHGWDDAQSCSTVERFVLTVTPSGDGYPDRYNIEARGFEGASDLAEKSLKTLAEAAVAHFQKNR